MLHLRPRARASRVNNIQWAFGLLLKKHLFFKQKLCSSIVTIIFKRQIAVYFCEALQPARTWLRATPWAVCTPCTHMWCGAPWCRWGQQSGFPAQVHSPADRMESGSGCRNGAGHSWNQASKHLQITAHKVLLSTERIKSGKSMDLAQTSESGVWFQSLAN